VIEDDPAVDARLRQLDERVDRWGIGLQLRNLVERDHALADAAASQLSRGIDEMQRKASKPTRCPSSSTG